MSSAIDLTEHDEAQARRANRKTFRTIRERSPDEQVASKGTMNGNLRRMRRSQSTRRDRVDCCGDAAMARIVWARRGGALNPQPRASQRRCGTRWQIQGVV